MRFRPGDLVYCSNANLFLFSSLYDSATKCGVIKRLEPSVVVATCTPVGGFKSLIPQVFIVSTSSYGWVEGSFFNLVQRL